jgi:hypothetical protein
VVVPTALLDLSPEERSRRTPMPATPGGSPASIEACERTKQIGEDLPVSDLTAA